VRSSLLITALLALGCGRVGFDVLELGASGDGGPDPAGADGAVLMPTGCNGSVTFGAGSTPPLDIPAEYGPTESPMLTVSADQVGCIYAVTVDGAGGGRGNHDNPTSNGDGGSGGRIIFEFVPQATGNFVLVVGGGGTGIVGTYTLDDPEPGASGGGSSQIAFLEGGTSRVTLAVAGGGGGGGWAEVGSDGGGGNGECGANADEGSTGGCNGATGTPHPGGDPGGNCPLDLEGAPIPCGGPGGEGSNNNGSVGGFGIGSGFGGDEVGSQGSGGGGGGFGGGSAGGGAGDPGLGGGAYFNGEVATFGGGSTGGAGNAARYEDSLALAGGNGTIEIVISEP
jgi:hypothetical protein